MIVLIVLLVFSFLGNCVLTWFIVRSLRRLLEFDDLFETFSDDIQVNVRFFQRLSSTPLLSNAPEVMEAHRKMGIMGKRLEEFVIRINEASRKGAQ